jgi:hypothetical protein
MTLSWLVLQGTGTSASAGTGEAVEGGAAGGAEGVASASCTPSRTPSAACDAMRSAPAMRLAPASWEDRALNFLLVFLSGCILALLARKFLILAGQDL